MESSSVAESVAPESDSVQSYIIDQTVQVSPQTADWTANIQGLKFTHQGKYVSGYVDSSQELVQLLENYRSVTGTAFTGSQNLVQVMKSMDESQLQMRFISASSRPRLFWQMNAGEPTIQYDGVPFMSVGHGTDLACIRYGGRRKKVENVSLPSGEVIPVDYRMKTGCEAKITIRRILRYPCAEYDDSHAHGVAAARRQRKQIFDDLIQRIIAGTAKFQERYHLLLPTPMAHNGHVIAEIDGPPPIDQQVINEIASNLNNNVTSLDVLRERVKSFVINTSSNPSLTSDPSFCPSDFDIFRQVYWLYKMGQVVDGQDSTYKSSMAGLLGGMDRSLSQTANQSPVSIAINSNASLAQTTNSSDALPTVYSIVMDDTSAEDSGLEQLGDHHISAEQEVDLNSGEGLDKSSNHISNQIQINTSSSPVSIPPGGGVSLLAKRSLLQNQSVKVSPRLPVTTTNGNKLRGSVSVGASADDLDESVSQAQTEVQSMLRIIENQTHACKNLSALNNLRRQLTELCGQFSVHLAGGGAADFGTPPTKRSRT